MRLSRILTLLLMPMWVGTTAAQVVVNDPWLNIAKLNYHTHYEIQPVVLMLLFHLQKQRPLPSTCPPMISTLKQFLTAIKEIIILPGKSLLDLPTLL